MNPPLRFSGQKQFSVQENWASGELRIEEKPGFPLLVASGFSLVTVQSVTWSLLEPKINTGNERTKEKEREFLLTENSSQIRVKRWCTQTRSTWRTEMLSSSTLISLIKTASFIPQKISSLWETTFIVLRQCFCTVALSNKIVLKLESEVC